MPKTKISEFSSTPANNTDIDSINIAENCAPSGINDAIRELMAQLKDFQTGAVGDSFNGPVGTTTAAAGAFTTLSASGAVTLSGGTANGVAYLNGSKVVTSGSSFSYDGAGVLTLGNDSVATVFNAVGDVAQYVVDSNGTGSSASHQWRYGSTEAMRLNSTGLGIGTSSPDAKLDVTSIGTASAYTVTAVVQDANYPASGNPTLEFNGFIAGNGYRSGIGSIGGQQLAFYTPSTFGVAPTERARIDSSGNLAVNTTNTTYGKVNIKATGSQIYSGLTAFSNDGTESFIGLGCTSSVAGISVTYGATGSYLPFVISTGGSERVRIDSSGNLLVGTTSVISAGKYSSSFAGATENGIILQTTLASTGSTYIGFVNSSGSVIGTITQSTSSTVAYNVTSDQRLKENIVDAPDFGSVIDSIQVRSFDWKTDHIHQRAGFIAQELVTVAPEAVHQPIKEDEMMAVDYSKLVPMLVKEIQSLRKRLADAGIA